MKSTTTKLYLCAIGVAFAGVLLWMAFRDTSHPAGVAYSQFLHQVHNGQVDTVTIEPTNTGATPASYRLKGGATARTTLPSDYRDAIAAMEDEAVNINIQESPWGRYRGLGNAIPFLILLLTWAFLMCRLKGRPLTL